MPARPGNRTLPAAQLCGALARVTVGEVTGVAELARGSERPAWGRRFPRTFAAVPVDDAWVYRNVTRPAGLDRPAAEALLLPAYHGASALREVSPVPH